MNKSKNIYIGAMSGTSYDAIDVSIIKIEKNITLESFYSKQIQLSFLKYRQKFQYTQIIYAKKNKKYDGIRIN